MPAVGLETLWRIVGEPPLNFAVDGYPVVVIDRNQFAQPERAGQRTGLVGNALHQTAIAQKDPGMVVDDVVAIAIELGSEGFLCQRHPHGIRDALPQRPGRGFNAGGIAIFRVAGRLAMELPELLQVFNGKFIPSEMQEGVDQHRAVAIGQHEPVAIGPIRIRRIVSHQAIPEHLCNIRHTHRRTGVAAFGRLDGVHSEGTNGVGQFRSRGHRCSKVRDKGLLSSNRRVRANLILKTAIHRFTDRKRFQSTPLTKIFDNNLHAPPVFRDQSSKL